MKRRRSISRDLNTKIRIRDKRSKKIVAGLKTILINVETMVDFTKREALRGEGAEVVIDTVETRVIATEVANLEIDHPDIKITLEIIESTDPDMIEIDIMVTDTITTGIMITIATNLDTILIEYEE